MDVREIFKSLKYGLAYDQATLDLGLTYRAFQKELLQLGEGRIPNNPRILDLCCGTGESTLELALIPGAKITGIDYSEEWLKLAEFKFGRGPLTSKDQTTLAERIRVDHPYPAMIGERVDVWDLAQHLTSIQEAFKSLGARVRFVHRDASDIEGTGEPYHLVNNNQGIHHFRKYMPNDGTILPNLDYEAYEARVLQAVHGVLVPHGLFLFNTSGADYKFRNDGLNRSHILEHPFYKAFQKELMQLMNRETPEERHFSFSWHDIHRILENARFMELEHRTQAWEHAPERLVEICVVGGHMAIMQNMTALPSRHERQAMLEEAVTKAYEHARPTDKPVMEYVVHFAAQKV